MLKNIKINEWDISFEFTGHKVYFNTFKYTFAFDSCLKDAKATELDKMILNLIHSLAKKYNYDPYPVCLEVLQYVDCSTMRRFELMIEILQLNIDLIPNFKHSNIVLYPRYNFDPIIKLCKSNKLILSFDELKTICVFYLKDIQGGVDLKPLSSSKNTISIEDIFICFKKYRASTIALLKKHKGSINTIDFDTFYKLVVRYDKVLVLMHKKTKDYFASNTLSQDIQFSKLNIREYFYLISQMTEDVFNHKEAQMFIEHTLDPEMIPNRDDTEVCIEYAWKYYFNRIPETRILRNNSFFWERVKYLKESGNFKYFLRITRKYFDEKFDKLTIHHYVAVFNCVMNLEELAENYYKWVISQCKNYDGFADIIHNFGYFMNPLSDSDGKEIFMNPAQRKFFWKNKNIKLDKNSTFPTCVKNIYELSLRFEELSKKANSTKASVLYLHSKINNYSNVINTDLALECSKWSISNDKFQKFQKKWLKNLTKLKSESIPYAEHSIKDYKIFKLDRDDPRGLFLGEYTDCCQSINGIGKYCAWHGATDKDGGFIVVTKSNNIIAQSWIWRVGDSIVIDNIEILGNGYDYNIIKELYNKFSQSMLNKLMIKFIFQGQSHNDLVLEAFLVDNIGTYRIDTELINKAVKQHDYTDAHNTHLVCCEEKCQQINRN